MKRDARTSAKDGTASVEDGAGIANSRPTNKVIAIDLGASGGKLFACTFESNSFRLTEIHRFSHEAVTFYMGDRDGSLEQRLFWDDMLLYDQIMTGLRIFGREIDGTADAIGIDTWGADGMLVSAAGTALGRMFAYRDHRLDAMIATVKERIDERRVYEITGIHFQPFNLSNQLAWLVLNRNEYLKQGTLFLPTPTLFNFYLAGAKEVDSSWASVSQLMDSRTKSWSKEILHALEIPIWLMPRIVPPGTVLGALHERLASSVGLSQAQLIAVGSHDTASAYAAAPVRDPGEALIISSGTWSLVGKLIPEPITTPEAMAANMSNEGGIGNIRFLKNCMGTWIVQELRRVWRHQDGSELSWEQITQLTVRGTACAFIDPDDASFYNPANMQEAITAYCRRTAQGVPRDRPTLLRTVLESLALKYRLVNDQICSISGKPTQVIHIVGGGSKNELLNQMTADACCRPVVAGPEEATAVGNAMLQAIAVGVIHWSDVLPLIQDAFTLREYTPADSQKWERTYDSFKVALRKAGNLP